MNNTIIKPFQYPYCGEFLLRIAHVTTINGTLNAYWLSSNARFLDVVITDSDIRDIQPNAFTTVSFRRTIALTLNALTLTYLRDGIFNGLFELVFLVLSAMRLLTIDAGIMKMNLGVLMIKNCSPSVDHTLWWFNVTTSPFYNLDTIQIIRNEFPRSLSKESFGKLRRLHSLDLSYNRIEYIHDGTFDVFNRTLKSLNLRNNQLKVIPFQLFDVVLTYKLEEILLENNPWHCNCHLQHLKETINKFPSIFSGCLECSWPQSLNGAIIQTAEMCPGSIAKPTEILGKCNKYAIPEMKAYIDIALKQRDKMIRLRRISAEIMEIQLDEFPTDHILVWYENGVPTPELQCWLNRNAQQTKNIKLRFDALAPNRVYTLCMKRKHSMVANPLNCISFDTFYHANRTPTVLVPMHLRSVAIAVFVVAGIFSVFLGFVIVIVLGRNCERFANSFLLLQRDDNGDEASNRDSTSQQSGKDFHSISETRKCSDVPPPLPPPHPEQLKRRHERYMAREGLDIDDDHYEHI